ncbi:DUF3024 domain-containing protein [Magnetospirillum gryphiswaldense]|uniref:DUF3024 domain-containing protein n=1 Tax=Magnetospirillum gryphiswaldense TaxID=55518 RepID=UPI000D040C01|nr:hypothetical protein [Magnetospirillum gryphiswaldense]AVM76175.1 hypothetical protein MSR1_37170 [Magnetospirillum gryphiswaldense MSR-1]AVM80078.1 hypothetical protein MSR1L_37170 [Magnetospirillum gryphiswaldense]
MAKRQKVWVKVLTKDDKAAIAATCERFIAGVLIPRFLPEIRPTEFNYPVAITGRWRGDRYSFIQRYRSGFADNAGEEFDAPFARLDHAGGDRFVLMWRRHTGQWWPLRADVTLPEALALMETEGLVQPP